MSDERVKSTIEMVIRTPGEDTRRITVKDGVIDAECKPIDSRDITLFMGNDPIPYRTKTTVLTVSTHEPWSLECRVDSLRTWVLPPEPDVSVKAVREADGERRAWLRIETIEYDETVTVKWRPKRIDGDWADFTWREVILEAETLTDATAELEES